MHSLQGHQCPYRLHLGGTRLPVLSVRRHRRSKAASLASNANGRTSSANEREKGMQLSLIDQPAVPLKGLSHEELPHTCRHVQVSAKAHRQLHLRRRQKPNRTEDEVVAIAAPRPPHSSREMLLAPIRCPFKLLLQDLHHPHKLQPCHHQRLPAALRKHPLQRLL